MQVSSIDKGAFLCVPLSNAFRWSSSCSSAQEWVYDQLPRQAGADQAYLSTKCLLPPARKAYCLALRALHTRAT